MTTYIIMSSWTSPYPWGILESLGKSRNWHLLTMRQYNIFPWIGTGSNSKIWDWKLLEWHKHKQLSSSVWSIPHIIGGYSHLDRSSAGQSPAEPRRVSFLPLYHETRLPNGLICWSFAFLTFLLLADHLKSALICRAEFVCMCPQPMCPRRMWI